MLQWTHLHIGSLQWQREQHKAERFNTSCQENVPLSAPGAVRELDFVHFSSSDLFCSAAAQFSGTGGRFFFFLQQQQQLLFF